MASTGKTSQATRSHPSLANAAQTAAPMPRAAPVTIAVFPLRSMGQLIGAFIEHLSFVTWSSSCRQLPADISPARRVPVSPVDCSAVTGFESRGFHRNDRHETEIPVAGV